jgi:hypothetical protein
MGFDHYNVVKSVANPTCGLSLALHYSSQVYFRGEAWSSSFSLMQLGGFVMATLGTLLYGRGDAVGLYTFNAVYP